MTSCDPDPHLPDDMPEFKIRNCPERPPCPMCDMSMIRIQKIEDDADLEHCVFKCLRCGHVETSEPVKAGTC
jgi:hypothetical protein